LALRDIIELNSGRLFLDLTSGVLGSPDAHSVLMATDRSTGYFVSRTSIATGSPANTGFARHVPEPYRYPELLLPYVLSRPLSTRSIGTQTLEGKKYNVVSFVDPSGIIYMLFFDPESGLLSRYSWLMDDATYSISGDLPREVVYSDYREVGGLMTAFHYAVWYGGELLEDLRVTDIKINTHPADSAFDPPKGLPPPPRFQTALDVNKLGDCVYWIRAAYNSMFLVFNDYVLVIEGPVNDALTQQAIAEIKKAAPGKPIRYVVPTHYHHDHIGGLRGFVAEGATVVTTRGVESEMKSSYASRDYYAQTRSRSSPPCSRLNYSLAHASSATRLIA
jgi:hypothetical protein